jgi:hypothetical protein
MNQANQLMIGEGDKVYQDQLRKYQDAVAQKNALRQAGMTNIGNAFNSAETAANMDDTQINFGNIFKRGKGLTGVLAKDYPRIKQLGQLGTFSPND